MVIRARAVPGVPGNDSSPGSATIPEWSEDRAGWPNESLAAHLAETGGGRHRAEERPGALESTRVMPALDHLDALDHTAVMPPLDPDLFDSSVDADSQVDPRPDGADRTAIFVAGALALMLLGLLIYWSLG